MIKLRKYANIIYIFFAVILAAIGFISGRSVPVAFAASGYSDVLDDLQIDETFDISAYPEDPQNGKLEVINIAESTDGELLIYVYRPSAGVKELPATEIRISTTVGDSYSPKDYALRLISANGTLEKYVVEDLTVKPDALRYYDIICIFRPFDSDYDDSVSGGNTVSETAIPVNKGYTATTVEGVVSYTCTEIETIEITDKYVGYVNYSDGTQLRWGGMTSSVTSAHFVAFDTDKPIDKLMSAEVQFKEQSISCKLCANMLHTGHEYKQYYDYTYGTSTKHDPIIVNADETAFNPGGGDIKPGNSYTWKRIQKTSEFLADTANKGYILTSKGAEGFAGTKWVLNFYETEVSAKGGDDLWKGLAFGLIGTYFIEDVECKATRVSDVTVLRLEFETDGKVYNLGVVDNKQTGNGGAFTPPSDKVPSWVWWLIGGIALIIILIIIIAFLPNGINVVISIVTAIGKSVYFVIVLPFRLLYWIVDSIVGRRDGGDK